MGGRTIARVGAAFAVGIAAGAAWGFALDALAPGLTLGVILGSGLGLMFALPRIRRGLLAAPTWHGLAGAALVGFALAAFWRPTVLFDPTWALSGLREVSQAPATGDAPRVRVFADQPQPAIDAAAAALAPMFATEMERFIGEVPSHCAVDVYVVRSARTWEAARRFGASSDFGFAKDTVLSGPVIVMRGGSGWGTLTHLLASLWLDCAWPGAPPWVQAGLPAFFEKFTIDPVAGDAAAAGRFNWRWRSSWREPDLSGDAARIDMTRELVSPMNQGALRSFLRFLHARELLIPALAAARAGADPGLSAHVEAWRRWLPSESMRDAVLETATPGIAEPL